MLIQYHIILNIYSGMCQLKSCCSIRSRFFSYILSYTIKEKSLLGFRP